MATLTGRPTRSGYQRLAAKGRITDEELDEALAELEETGKSQRELGTFATVKNG